MEELDWMNEHVDRLPKYNWMYKLGCFIVGKAKKKMTYKEIYMIIKNLNTSKDNEAVAKAYAFSQCLVIYKFLNNKLPEGIQNDRL